MGVAFAVLCAAGCGGGGEENVEATSTTVWQADEDAFIDDAQVAAGAGVTMRNANGTLTEPGATTLETGYMTCDMTLDEFEDWFHETWANWRGPDDTPSGLHAAARAHLCA